MIEDTYEIRVPFQGFYNSIHSDIIDHAYESLFQDENGNVYEDLYEKVCDLIGHDSYEPYAKLYLKEICNLTGLNFTFDTLTSPKEYNFDTDKIYAFISKDDILKMWTGVNKETLSEIIKEECTSRVGFFSYYKPLLSEWDDSPLEWDHNQLEILLKAWSKSISIDLDHDDWSKLSENADNAIYEDMPVSLRLLADDAEKLREYSEKNISINQTQIKLLTLIAKVGILAKKLLKYKKRN